MMLYHKPKQASDRFNVYKGCFEIYVMSSNVWERAAKEGYIENCMERVGNNFFCSFLLCFTCACCFSRAEIACRVCCDSCLHHDEIVQSEPDGPGIMPRIPSTMKGPGKV